MNCSCIKNNLIPYIPLLTPAVKDYVVDTNLVLARSALAVAVVAVVVFQSWIAGFSLVALLMMDITQARAAANRQAIESYMDTKLQPLPSAARKCIESSIDACILFASELKKLNNIVQAEDIINRQDIEGKCLSRPFNKLVREMLLEK